eukprot:UC4_evm1s440
MGPASPLANVIIPSLHFSSSSSPPQPSRYPAQSASISALDGEDHDRNADDEVQLSEQSNEQAKHKHSDLAARVDGEQKMGGAYWPSRDINPNAIKTYVLPYKSASPLLTPLSVQFRFFNVCRKPFELKSTCIPIIKDESRPWSRRLEPSEPSILRMGIKALKNESHSDGTPLPSPSDALQFVLLNCCSLGFEVSRHERMTIARDAWKHAKARSDSSLEIRHYATYINAHVYNKEELGIHALMAEMSDRGIFTTGAGFGSADCPNPSTSIVEAYERSLLYTSLAHQLALKGDVPGVLAMHKLHAQLNLPETCAGLSEAQLSSLLEYWTGASYRPQARDAASALDLPLAKGQPQKGSGYTHDSKVDWISISLSSLESSLILAHSHNGSIESALQVFENAKEHFDKVAIRPKEDNPNVDFDFVPFSAAIYACAYHSRFDEALSLLKLGFAQNGNLSSSLLDEVDKLSMIAERPDVSLQVRQMKRRYIHISHSRRSAEKEFMFVTACVNGNFDEARKRLQDMGALDLSTLDNVAKILANRRDFLRALLLLEMAWDFDLCPSEEFYGAIISAYASNKGTFDSWNTNLRKIMSIFMSVRAAERGASITVCNAALKALYTSYVAQINYLRCNPNLYSSDLDMEGNTRNRFVNRISSLQKIMKHDGISPSAQIYEQLMELALFDPRAVLSGEETTRVGAVTRLIYDMETEGHYKTSLTWSMLIRAYAMDGQAELIDSHVLDSMRASGHPLTNYKIQSALIEAKLCANPDDMSPALDLILDYADAGCLYHPEVLEKFLHRVTEKEGTDSALTILDHIWNTSRMKRSPIAYKGILSSYTGDERDIASKVIDHAAANKIEFDYRSRVHLGKCASAQGDVNSLLRLMKSVEGKPLSLLEESFLFRLFPSNVDPNSPSERQIGTISEYIQTLEAAERIEMPSIKNMRIGSLKHANILEEVADHSKLFLDHLSNSSNTKDEHSQTLYGMLKRFASGLASDGEEQIYKTKGLLSRVIKGSNDLQQAAMFCHDYTVSKGEGSEAGLIWDEEKISILLSLLSKAGMDLPHESILKNSHMVGLESVSYVEKVLDELHSVNVPSWASRDMLLAYTFLVKDEATRMSKSRGNAHSVDATALCELMLSFLEKDLKNPKSNSFLINRAATDIDENDLVDGARIKTRPFQILSNICHILLTKGWNFTTDPQRWYSIYANAKLQLYRDLDTKNLSIDEIKSLLKQNIGSVFRNLLRCASKGDAGFSSISDGLATLKNIEEETGIFPDVEAIAMIRHEYFVDKNGASEVLQKLIPYMSASDVSAGHLICGLAKNGALPQSCILDALNIIAKNGMKDALNSITELCDITVSQLDSRKGYLNRIKKIKVVDAVEKFLMEGSVDLGTSTEANQALAAALNAGILCNKPTLVGFCCDHLLRNGGPSLVESVVDHYVKNNNNRDRVVRSTFSFLNKNKRYGECIDLFEKLVLLRNNDPLLWISDKKIIQWFGCAVEEAVVEGNEDVLEKLIKVLEMIRGPHLRMSCLSRALNMVEKWCSLKEMNETRKGYLLLCQYLKDAQAIPSGPRKQFNYPKLVLSAGVRELREISDIVKLSESTPRMVLRAIAQREAELSLTDKNNLDLHASLSSFKVADDIKIADKNIKMNKIQRMREKFFALDTNVFVDFMIKDSNKILISDNDTIIQNIECLAEYYELICGVDIMRRTIKSHRESVKQSRKIFTNVTIAFWNMRSLLENEGYKVNFKVRSAIGAAVKRIYRAYKEHSELDLLPSTMEKVIQLAYLDQSDSSRKGGVDYTQRREFLAVGRALTHMTGSASDDMIEKLYHCTVTEDDSAKTCALDSRLFDIFISKRLKLRKRDVRQNAKLAVQAFKDKCRIHTPSDVQEKKEFYSKSNIMLGKLMGNLFYSDVVDLERFLVESNFPVELAAKKNFVCLHVLNNEFERAMALIEASDRTERPDLAHALVFACIEGGRLAEAKTIALDAGLVDHLKIPMQLKINLFKKLCQTGDRNGAITCFDQIKAASDEHHDEILDIAREFNL